MQDFLGNEIKINDKVVIVQDNNFAKGVITNVGIDTNKQEYVIVLLDNVKTISKKKLSHEVVKI